MDHTREPLCLGPTAMHLQGDNLTRPLRCIFSNLTDQLPAPAVITPAAIINASTAMCTSPTWTVGLKGSPVQLTVTSNQCQTRTQFFYYPTPLVRDVEPLAAPRYGSFMMTVFLDQDLQAISVEKVGR